MAKNVGILAMDIYFPLTCIQQEVLEAHDGASKGKYTIGLGQDCMAFCTEVEDVISMSLTVVTSLLEKYGVDPKQIGRLEVGSETVIDKSKSIKTFLMGIFEKCGNTDIEGVDSTNACYGGTAALFNCVNWVESSSWDGRYGLVVCTDSAVYAEGPARPTGGAAAIAILIGPDAPISFQSKVRGSHMAHVYDFYKSNLASEYLVVDGKLSQTCYLMALDSCYKQMCNKYENIANVMDVARKLKSRHEFPPDKFVETMHLMEHRYGAKDFVTSKDISLLSPGTNYLTEVDSMYRRFYAKKDGNSTTGTPYENRPWAATVCTSDPSVPTAPSLASSLTTADIEKVVQQVLSRTFTTLSTSTTLGKQPWFFDTACYNHMTPDESQFSDMAPLEHPFTIYTADGTPMPVSYKGTISSPCLSLSDTFHIPKLSFNLLSVGQLCELGVDLLFTNHGVDVKDPQTGKVLGKGRKVGRMFEVLDLNIPSQVISAKEGNSAIGTLCENGSLVNGQ